MILLDRLPSVAEPFNIWNSLLISHYRGIELGFDQFFPEGQRIFISYGKTQGWVFF